MDQAGRASAFFPAKEYTPVSLLHPAAGGHSGFFSTSLIGLL